MNENENPAGQAIPEQDINPPQTESPVADKGKRCLITKKALIPAILLLLTIFTLVYAVIYLLTKTDKQRATEDQNQVGGQSEYSPQQPWIEYADYEPPLHPVVGEMLEKVDKLKLVVGDLNWVKYAKVIKESGADDKNTFDFEFPDDYFALEVSFKRTGSCVELRGKEEVMFEICNLENVYYIANLTEEFRAAADEVDFNGRKAMHRISSEINIFPKEEMLIVNEGDADTAKTAIHIKYPRQNIDGFVPDDPAIWDEYKEGYVKADLPISKRLLDSFVFK